MSFFDKIFGPNPKQHFEPFQKIIEQRIAQHDAALAGMSIPVPKRTSEINYQTKKYQRAPDDTRKTVRIRASLPHFEIPPNIILCVLKAWLVFTDELEEVKARFELMGLGGAVQLPHVTTSHNPYQFYIKCNKHPMFCFDISHVDKSYESELDSKYLQYSVPKQLPNLTLAKAAALNFRVQLYNHLTNYFNDKSGLLKIEPWHPWNENGIVFCMPREVLWNTSIQVPYIDPPINTKVPYKTIKVLPAEEIKPALMVSLFSNLRSINSPIAGTVNLVLST